MIAPPAPRRGCAKVYRVAVIYINGETINLAARPLPLTRPDNFHGAQMLKRITTQSAAAERPVRVTTATNARSPVAFSSLP